MSRAVVVSHIARGKAGWLGVMVGWGRASGVTVLMTLSLVFVGAGAPGDLDPTPGMGGTVTTDFGGLDQAIALVLQPDGKLVAAGYAGNPGFALARYLPNGSLDLTFGTGGLVITDFGGNNTAPTGLILQPDGKLVVAGGACVSPATHCDFALARYLPNGSLDPAFGMGGKVTTDFTGVEGFDDAFSLVLQPDGKLVEAGRACISSDASSETHCDFALARYLPDGHLDPTFGIGGKVTTDFGGNDAAIALVLQPDSKLVAAGITGVTNDDFALARYLPDGHLDATFGVGGTVTTDFGGFFDLAHALVLQPDGKLVAAGDGCGDIACAFALARYQPDGSMDPTFGVVGKVTGPDGGASALVLQPDGKLVAAGSASALVRYLPDGRLDPTFGTGFEST